ncbi:N-acetyltransferase [Streptococcus iniae]|uniref:GNAT family N-acetyltransferase n=1 Tax=Streptococcus iniae TaxID=1346 RepID=UPI0008DA5D65|nr:N-acetyltransferase [Streptococcus iniae]OHX28092.1 GNAT family N-acetyltransferase [Streptococcus iniae]RLV27722.1 N-acetyltransferase [Streptococcus iniae]
MAYTIGIKEVSHAELPLLQELAIKTFDETFGHDNSPEQLKDFYQKAYDLTTLEAELNDPETEIDFLMLDGRPVGYLKINWGSAQTEQELDGAIEIQRIYILKEFQGQGLGKYLFEYALQMTQATEFNWVWLGVWEHNVKAQSLYQKYGFEKFAEHSFTVGDKTDTDWLMKKSLK